MSPKKPAQPVVLVAEDEANDRDFLRYAALLAQPKFVLRFVNDGAQVLEYLKREGGFVDDELFPLPKVLLLDFHLPKLSGLEVIEWLANSTEFKDLRVILMTGSTDSDLLSQVKKQHTASFQKPMDVTGWVELIRGVQALLDNSRKS
jgi:CheY-like chemotaxis protein